MTAPAEAPLTREVADFAARIGETGVPRAALEVVRLGFTDCAAVLLAGRGESSTEAVLAFARRENAAGPSRLLLGAERTTPRLAALVNATAAHALDWDDYAFANHPSAVLAPTILAVAEATGVDGRAMAAAYVAGYEAWAALMEREPDHLHSKGWHPTGLFGPIAAAVASALLMRLDAERTRHAVAIAASHAGGVMANFGTDTKPYHGGKAAAAGVTAASLAAAGLRAGERAIEDRLGLLAALSPAGRADRGRPMELGRRWRILESRLNIKKYPTVGASQRTIDSILALLAERRVDPGRIRALRPWISVKQAAVMLFHRPRTALEAKFSLEFATAAPFIAGKVGLAELSDAFVASPELGALMEKVEIVTTEDSDPGYPIAAREAYVTVVLDDGAEVRSPPVRRASGHAEVPLSTDQIWAKFRDCASAAGVAEPKARRLFERMQAIDRVPEAAAVEDV